MGIHPLSGSQSFCLNWDVAAGEAGRGEGTLTGQHVATLCMLDRLRCLKQGASRGIANGHETLLRMDRRRRAGRMEAGRGLGGGCKQLSGLHQGRTGTESASVTVVVGMGEPRLGLELRCLDLALVRIECRRDRWSARRGLDWDDSNTGVAPLRQRQRLRMRHHRWRRWSERSKSRRDAHRERPLGAHR